MLLYNSPVSGNCYKVRLLLAHLGIPYERRELDVVDRSNRAEVLGDLNPALRVPTLVLDDGRPSPSRTRSSGTSARARGSCRMTGTSARKVLQWMFFEQYSHEPYDRRRHGSGRVLRRRQTATRSVSSEKTQDGYRALDAIERHLAATDGFVVGGAMTLADIALYAYTHVAHEGGFDLVRLPGDRVMARPGGRGAGARLHRGVSEHDLGQGAGWRLGRQLLDRSTSVSVVDVVGRLGAVSAWPDLTAELAVGGRRTNGRAGDVARAFGSGELVKAFVFRGATHYLTPRDAGDYLALRASSKMWELRSWVSYYGLARRTGRGSGSTCETRW